LTLFWCPFCNSPFSFCSFMASCPLKFCMQAGIFGALCFSPLPPDSSVESLNRLVLLSPQFSNTRSTCENVMVLDRCSPFDFSGLLPIGRPSTDPLLVMEDFASEMVSPIFLRSLRTFTFFLKVQYSRGDWSASLGVISLPFPHLNTNTFEIWGFLMSNSHTLLNAVPNLPSVSFLPGVTGAETTSPTLINITRPFPSGRARKSSLMVLMGSFLAFRIMLIIYLLLLLRDLLPLFSGSNRPFYKYTPLSPGLPVPPRCPRECSVTLFLCTETSPSITPSLQTWALL